MERLKFLQIRQNIFFRAQKNHSRKTPKFEHSKDGKSPKLTSSLLKDHQTLQKIVIIPTLSDPSRVRNACYF